MSTLKVNTIQHSNGTEALTIDSTGNTSFNGAVTGTPLGNRNLIINGDMRIAQRGTSTTGLQYNNDNNFPCCDRWMFSHFGSSSYTAAFTGSQDTDVPTGQGFVNSFKLACTTADATLEADTAVLVRQMIEAQNLTHLKYGTSSAEKITASFWVKSNVTGTYSLVFNQVDASKYYGADYTINTADTWEKKTITIDGNTSDVINNDNGIGFRMDFYLSVGSNYAGGTNEQWTTNTTGDVVPNMTNNIGGSTANYINITGVQVEVGEVATEFEHRPYDVELARCQRYYQKIIDRDSDGSGRMWLWNISGGNLWRRGYIVYTTTMRATPTATLDAYAGGGGTFVATPSFGNSSEKSGAIIADLTSGGDGYYAYVDNLYLDAEL